MGGDQTARISRFDLVTNALLFGMLGFVWMPAPGGSVRFRAVHVMVAPALPIRPTCCWARSARWGGWSLRPGSSARPAARSMRPNTRDGPGEKRKLFRERPAVVRRTTTDNDHMRDRRFSSRERPPRDRAMVCCSLPTRCTRSPRSDAAGGFSNPRDMVGISCGRIRDMHFPGPRSSGPHPGTGPTGPATGSILSRPGVRDETVRKRRGPAG